MARDKWFMWEDNKGMRCFCREEQIEAVFEGDPKFNEGIPLAGIKMSCGAFSWTNVDFSEICSEIRQDGKLVVLPNNGPTPRTESEDTAEDHATPYVDSKVGF